MRCPSISALRFTSLFSLLILLPTATRAQNNCLGNKSIVGYCTPLTFADTTGQFAAPPTASDCQDTCAGVNGDPGDWLVDFSTDASGAVHPMLLYPCGFAVAAGEGTPKDARFSVANQDILDLYDESLLRFGGSHGGRISAEGTMMCAGFEIKWFIEDLNA